MAKFIATKQVPRQKDYLAQLSTANKLSPARKLVRSQQNVDSANQFDRMQELWLLRLRNDLQKATEYYQNEYNAERQVIKQQEKRLEKARQLMEIKKEKLVEIQRRKQEQFKDLQKKSMDFIIKDNIHTQKITALIHSRQNGIDEIKKRQNMNIYNFQDLSAAPLKINLNVERFYTKGLVQSDRTFQRIISAIANLQPHIDFDPVPTKQMLAFLNSVKFDYPEFYFLNVSSIRLVYQNSKDKGSVKALSNVIDFKSLTQEQLLGDNLKIGALYEQLDRYIAEYSKSRPGKQLTELQREVLAYEFLTTRGIRILDVDISQMRINLVQALDTKQCNEATFCSLLQLLLANQNIKSFIVQGKYRNLDGDGLVMGGVEERVHFWNVVQLINQYYYVDCVFDNHRNRFEFKHLNFNARTCQMTRSVEKTVKGITVSGEIMNKKEFLEKIR